MAFDGTEWNRTPSVAILVDRTARELGRSAEFAGGSTWIAAERSGKPRALHLVFADGMIEAQLIADPKRVRRGDLVNVRFGQ